MGVRAELAKVTALRFGGEPSYLFCQCTYVNSSDVFTLMQCLLGSHCLWLGDAQCCTFMFLTIRRGEFLQQQL
jgi:hypothetical protein